MASKYFVQINKGGRQGLLDLSKVQGFWEDNHAGTVILISGNEVWISMGYSYFLDMMEKYWRGRDRPAQQTSVK